MIHLRAYSLLGHTIVPLIILLSHTLVIVYFVAHKIISPHTSIILTNIRQSMWRLVYRTIESWAARLSHHVVQYNHISHDTLKRLTNLFIDEDEDLLEDGVAALLVNVRRHLDEIEQLYVHVASNYNKYGEINWERTPSN